MKNKNVFSFLLILVLSSCGGGRHNQQSAGGQALFSWEISFTPGTTERQQHKIIDEIETSVRAHLKKDDPRVIVNFHTIPHNERLILLNASSTQGTKPRTPTGGPHFPGLEEFLHLKNVENIVPKQLGASSRQGY